MLCESNEISRGNDSPVNSRVVTIDQCNDTIATETFTRHSLAYHSIWQTDGLTVLLFVSSDGSQECGIFHTNLRVTVNVLIYIRPPILECNHEYIKQTAYWYKIFKKLQVHVLLMSINIRATTDYGGQKPTSFPCPTIPYTPPLSISSLSPVLPPLSIPYTPPLSIPYTPTPLYPLYSHPSLFPLYPLTPSVTPSFFTLSLDRPLLSGIF